MKYERPTIEVVGASVDLLTVSGPGATDIFAPDFDNNSKSVWDEVDNTYNINKEENYGEDWI